MARSDKLYGDSPKMERDEETGEVWIKKPSEADKESAGLGGQEIQTHQVGERREMAHRHVGERLAMHHRHETDHEHGKEDHKRHHEELKAMHTRHEGEMKEMADRHEKGAKTGGAHIKKVEEAAKKED